MSISEFFNNPAVQLASNVFLAWSMYRLGRTRGMMFMDKELHGLMMRMHNLIQCQRHAIEVANAHLENLRAKEKE